MSKGVGIKREGVLLKMNISNGILSILEIPSDISYWLVRANGGTYYEDFFLNNFISIGDNDITLNDLNNITNNNTDESKILQLYKELYQSKRGKQNLNTQQIAHAASRTFKFVNEISIGDIVIVPSRRSERFVIGIVESDPFEITNADIEKKKSKFPIDENHKRREVRWIKEVNRNDISEKLYWIFSAHQSILCLNDNSDYINRLISPIYIQDKQFHGVIKINTKKDITSTEWYDFYSLVKQIDQLNKSATSVKPNVQSPGIIEFISQNWESIASSIAILTGIVFGEVDIKGARIQGIVPYLKNQRNRELDIKLKELEIEKKKLEIKDKELEIKSKEIDIKTKESNILKSSSPTLNLKELKNMCIAENISKALEISTFDAGRIVSSQKQMENDGYLDEDKSE